MAKTLKESIEESTTASRELAQDILDGKHEDSLKKFLDDGPLQGLHKLAEEVKNLSVPSRLPVLLMPGGYVTQLGKSPDDIIWFNAERILTDWPQLSLNSPPGGNLTQQGFSTVIDLYFAYIEFRLMLSGFPVYKYPYDWRQGSDVTGKEVAEYIRENTAEHKINIVTHSLGGIVTRGAMAYLGDDADALVNQIVLIACPNKGLYSMPGILHGDIAEEPKFSFESLVNPHVADEKKSIIDILLDDCLREVFSGVLEEVVYTWNSHVQLLPLPGHPGGKNLFSLEDWPTTSPRPTQDILDNALKIAEQLARPGKNWSHLIGNGKKTVTGVEVSEEMFTSLTSDGGDISVSLNLAEMAGLPCKTYPGISHYTEVLDPELVDEVITLLKR